MLPSIEPIEEKISNGCAISESEMLAYIHFKCLERGKVNPEDKNKLFTLIWYNHETSSSEMILTTAPNSIEAIVKGSSQYPLATNVSAYPIHLPKNLKFIPDEII